MYINGLKMIDEDFIPKEYIPGKRYCVNWAKRDSGFRLESVEGDMVIMYDNHKKSKFQTAKDSLRLQKSQAYKNAKKRLS